MKTEAKESIKKILVICFASFLMALNIKSFVRTGGLYPGGATGLALLIESSGYVFTYYHSIYHCQYTAQCDTGVYRFSIHW